MPPMRSKKRDVCRLFLHQETSISGNDALPTRSAREATPNYMPSSPPVMEESTLLPTWPMERSYNDSPISSPISLSERLLLPARPSRKIFRESSPIRPSEGPLRQVACQQIEEENNVEEETLSESDHSEAERNAVFLNEMSSEDSGFDSDSDSDSDTNAAKKDWEDEEEGLTNQEASWLDSGRTSKAKEKLIKILRGKAFVPRQKWSFRKIFATLLHHREDRRLRRPFGQLRAFFCKTMIMETTEGGQWPGALQRRDINMAIQLRFQPELEKRYGREVQTLCKTSGPSTSSGSAFGMINTTATGCMDLSPLEGVVKQSQLTASLLSSLVRSVGPSSRSPTAAQLVAMKQVAILIILCRLANQNNSNYLPLLLALYMYSAGARVDAITLFNHLGLSVSYNVLRKRLRDITQASLATIKAQASNPRLVGA